MSEQLAPGVQAKRTGNAVQQGRQRSYWWHAPGCVSTLGCTTHVLEDDAGALEDDGAALLRQQLGVGRRQLRPCEVRPYTVGNYTSSAVPTLWA